MYNLCHILLGNESCCIGLLLCTLAMLNKPRWEQVMTGAADLFPDGPIDSQIIAKKILDCVVKRSHESLTLLFPSVPSQSISLNDKADTVTEKECDAEIIIVEDQTVSSEATSDQEKPTEQLSARSANKEKKRLAALADCKSAHHEGFWISSCKKSVKEFEKYIDDTLRNVHSSEDVLQRQRMIKSLIFSPSKMMTVEELTDVVGIDSYEKASMFRKHFKRSFLNGKNALPVYIKDPPKGTLPSMKKELTLVILKQDSEESAFDRAVERQKEISQKYSQHTMEPNFPEMKETYTLFEDEKSKPIGKSLLKSAGFSDSHLRKNLKFSKRSLERADRKVSSAKAVLPGMWKKAFDVVRSRHPGQTDSSLLPKAKLLMKKFGSGRLLSREKSALAHRPRKDIDPSILETIVEVSATSSDSGNLTHAKRHYDVKYLASIKESVETNKKLSAGRLREHCNLIAGQIGMPTASVSTLKRRCLAPHLGHSNSMHYSNEAKIKFGKVPDTGSSVPPINIQYCRAFVKTEQRKRFRFDERFPHLREYSIINSTDAKAPIILGSKNSFNTGRTWLSYVNEDDRWSPLEEKEEDATSEGKRKIAKDEKLVQLQALPCHDYHSPRDVIVPNTNYIEKSFNVDEKSGRESVAVIVSPKFEYSNGAITHVNERYQLRRFGDKEVNMKMTLAHTDVPTVSLQYLLGVIHPWLHSIRESECLSKYLADVDETEASKLSSFLRKLSQDLFIVPTPPLSVIPIYRRDPSTVLEKLRQTLGEEKLKQQHVPVSAQSTGTAQETYSTMLAMKKSLIENELEECAFEVENVGRVKIVSALQRVIDHVIIRTNGLPLNELGVESSTIDGLAWIEKTIELLNELSNGEKAENQEDTVYLREMYGASLMLEIAESLESSEDVLLNKASLEKCDSTESSSLDALEVLRRYNPLVEGRAISLDCEPRPFNYRLVDGGPDQKQSHLPTKIAAALSSAWK